jgi:phage-related protein (TIGR01555 family)
MESNNSAEVMPLAEVINQLLTTMAVDHAAQSKKVEFKAPSLPPGVVPEAPASKFLALDSAPLQNLYAYLNRSALYSGMAFPGYQVLAELTQRSEYRAPAETIATEMTRRWCELVGDGDGDKSQKIKELTQDMEEFGLKEIARRVIMQDYFFGRSQVAIVIKGHENKTQNPLRLDDKAPLKGRLEGLRVIEPMWSTPLAWNSVDATAPDFYKPTSWYVMGKEWHATRLLTFVGRELPDMLKPVYNFSGMSMSQLIDPYVQRWLRTVESVNRLLSNFSKLGLKTNLQTALAGDIASAQAMLKRVQLYTQTSDNRGVLVMDKNSEEMFLLNTPLAGLHELQAQAQEHMAAPTHIPLVKGTGITPSGLNASSEGEIKVYYDWCHASQEAFLGPHMKTLIDLLQLNRYGTVDPGIKVRWIPLDQPTDVELAAIRKSDADAGAVYITNGVIAPEEERERLQGDPTSGYDNLDGPAPTPPEEAQHQLGEESADKAHERSEESAEAQHERTKELAKIDDKGKAK